MHPGSGEYGILTTLWPPPPTFTPNLVSGGGKNIGRESGAILGKSWSLSVLSLEGTSSNDIHKIIGSYWQCHSQPAYRYSRLHWTSFSFLFMPTSFMGCSWTRLNPDVQEMTSHVNVPWGCFPLRWSLLRRWQVSFCNRTVPPFFASEQAKVPWWPIYMVVVSKPLLLFTQNF